MSHEEYSAKLLGMEGAIIESIEENESEIHVYLHLKRAEHNCPRCGESTSRIHDYRWTELMDAPIRGKAVRLHYHRRRYVCEACGKKFAEKNGIVGKYHRITARLSMLGLDMLHQRRSAKSVAEELYVSQSSAQRWVAHLGYPKPDRLPTVLSIDEFRGNAQGQRFQCIFTAPAQRKVLDILPDRSTCTIQSYLKSFPNRHEVKCFVMDMNKAYLRIAQTFLPNATIIIDRFHYVRYCVWALENVRKRVQKALPPHQRKWFKRSRKLLVSRMCKLSHDDKRAVEIMINFSEDLTRAYLLKEKFFEFVDANDRSTAEVALNTFWQFAQKIDLPEFRPCLRMLKNWSPFILNSFQFRYSNGFTEGANNAIKTLKRAAFGFRSFTTFRNRILHAFA